MKGRYIKLSLQSILPYRIPNLNGRKLADPHVVIIGAGASIAACKKDKFGKEVPVLKNIHHILGLTSELNKYGFTDSEMADFELLYSNIYGKKIYGSYYSVGRKVKQQIC